MPRIRDLFDGTIRTVTDDQYAEWIQIPSRFQAVRDDETSEPTAIHEEPVTTASDLVGTGKATTNGFTDVPWYGARGDGTDTPTDTIRVATPIEPPVAPQPAPTPTES